MGEVDTEGLKDLRGVKDREMLPVVVKEPLGDRLRVGEALKVTEPVATPELEEDAEKV